MTAILTVTFENSICDESGLCVFRENDGDLEMLKCELGEQADILYQLLTEQTAKAIQALEQEPILDKIRSEIAEIPKKYPMTMDYENGLKEALTIIDKYKAESEG